MIHKTAIINSKAKISNNVKIGAYSIIGPNVEIGENTVIQSHVNISGNVKIGKENKIYPFVSINDPQDLKYAGEPTNLIIGDNNTIREYVTINPGTVGGGGKTVIGNNCLFMISSHIAHDCQVGNNVIIANNVPLGGHAIIEDNVVIGGNSAVQQFTRIGKMAMIGGMTGVLHDVIPYGLSTGNRNSLQGLNLIGLRRAKFENKDIFEYEIEERAHKGIFLAFQYPLEIPGVNTNIFLKTSLNAIRKARGEKELDAIEFLKLVKQKAKELKFDEEKLNRQLNVGFSGGEKKKNEILQMSMLAPKLSILDETDSGLDIDALKIVADGVNTLRNKNNSFLIITHYQRLLDYIKPDFVHVLMNGKIIRSGGPELAIELEKKGYESFN